uniref:G patch domain-containing protein 11 n=1 Tax=Globodera pallida TaxID=36090 RepID=A0A183BJU9_GLOPA
MKFIKITSTNCKEIVLVVEKGNFLIGTSFNKPYVDNVRLDKRSDNLNFLEIDCLIANCIQEFPCIKKGMFFYQERLVQYSVSKKDLASLCQFVVQTLIPSAVQNEVCPPPSAANRRTSIKSARNGFMVDGAMLVDYLGEFTEHFFPKVFLRDSDATHSPLSAYELVAYRVRSATACFFVHESCMTKEKFVEFIENLADFIDEKIAAITSQMGADVSLPIHSDIPYHFIYYNPDSLSLRKSFSTFVIPGQNSPPVAQLPPSNIHRLTYETYDRFASNADVFAQIFLKADNDCSLLAKIEDVKPGVGVGRENRRILRINAFRDDAIERQRAEKPKSKGERERDRLEEGLSNPICSGSKGFKLLAKMGYREGMSLGRRAEEGPRLDSRLMEPIPIQFKTDRAGIGLEEDTREKRKNLCEAHMESMRRRAEMEEELACDFRRRKRFAMEQKQLISEIQKLRKTCHEMDTTRSIKKLPDEFWFWPIYSRKKECVEETTDDSEGSVGVKRTKKELSDEDDDPVVDELYTYGNGEKAPMAINFYEFDNLGLQESLAKISSYMREVHFYCLYCGCAFTSSEEMDKECSGIAREDHE